MSPLPWPDREGICPSTVVWSIRAPPRSTVTGHVTSRANHWQGCGITNELVAPTQNLSEGKDRMGAGKQPTCGLEPEHKCHYQDSLPHCFPSHLLYLFSRIHGLSAFPSIWGKPGHPQTKLYNLQYGFQREEPWVPPAPAQNNPR